MNDRNRWVVVSNRLPVTIERGNEGYTMRPSTGGLVTALQPALKNREGCWIGWTGTDTDPEIERLIRFRSAEGKCCLVPVFLTEEERANFYCGFSNEIVWPLFHDLQSRCNFDPAYWQTYLQVNRKFAEAAATVTRANDFVWIHDYHLMEVGRYLRRSGVETSLAFFLHIPFPAPDIFEKLPWRSEILSALLQHDEVGFQTVRDRENFINCVRRLAGDARLTWQGDLVRVERAGRVTEVGAFPIGIDAKEFVSLALSPETAARTEQLRHDLAGCQVVLGVDRLDYTKGIPERLRAFRTLLEQYPELHHRITLVQVVVPSREEIPEYQELKLEVQRLVSEINGRFGEPGWVPVYYIHRHLERAELVAHYRAADIALITPLKDGMNLVAKEFVATQVSEPGVLILSEFAGAASQLQCGAVLVNPYDTAGVAESLYRAYHMSAGDRRERMNAMRENVQQQDVFRWCNLFCQHTYAAGANVGPKGPVSEKPKAFLAASP